MVESITPTAVRLLDIVLYCENIILVTVRGTCGIRNERFGKFAFGAEFVQSLDLPFVPRIFSLSSKPLAGPDRQRYCRILRQGECLMTIKGVLETSR